MDASITRALKATRLDQTFRSYYLNDRKIDDLFLQQFDGLVEFAKVHGKEVASEIGGSIKSGLLSLLIGLEADVQAKRAEKRKVDESGKHVLAPLVRLKALLAKWREEGDIHALEQCVTTGHWPPHTLTEYKGAYSFGSTIEELGVSLSLAQAQAVNAERDFEEDGKGERQYLFAPRLAAPCIAVLSRPFLTSVGFRHLRLESGETTETLFFGAIIAVKHGVVFLDPIAIGHYLKVAA